MKKNRIYIIGVIVLGIVALVLILSRTNSTFTSAKNDFAIDDTASVTKIFMSDKNNNMLTLTRKNAGEWTVNNKYEAHRTNIRMILGTLLQLEVKSPVAKAARNNIIRDMAANSVKVEVYQWKYRISLFNAIRLFPHEKLTRVYYVGSPTQDNRGTYMVMEHSDTPYIVYLQDLRGFVSSRYSPIEKYWRDYSLFRKTIPEIRMVKLEYPSNPANSFVVIRDGRRMGLTDISGQPVPVFDTIKLMNFLNSFKNLTFEAIVDEMALHKKDSILSSPPLCIISVKDTANIIQSISAYRRPANPGDVDDNGRPLPYDFDRLFVVTNTKELTIAQYFVLDKALRTLPWFTGDSTRAKVKR